MDIDEPGLDNSLLSNNIDLHTGVDLPGTHVSGLAMSAPIPKSPVREDAGIDLHYVIIGHV